MRMVKGYYIASGFFDEYQLGFVQKLERILEKNGTKFFSPRLESKITSGVENKAEQLIATYDGNVTSIDEYSNVVLVLDKKLDTGTIFELGYALSHNKDIKIIAIGSEALNFLESQVIPLNLTSKISIKKLPSYNGFLPPTRSEESIDLEIGEYILFRPEGTRFFGWEPEEHPIQQSGLIETGGSQIHVFNAGNRKNDLSISLNIGRSVALGHDVIVYADDIKSANLMLALCTPYFVIGKENLHSVILNLTAGDRGTKGCLSIEDLKIV